MLANLVKEGLKSTDSSVLITAENCPKDVQIHIREQNNGDIKIIHLLNHSLTNHSVQGIKLTIPLKARKVFYAIDKKPVETEMINGLLTIKLRDFEIYEMIVIKGK